MLLDSCADENSFTHNSLSSRLIENARTWHHAQTHSPGPLSIYKKEILTPKFSEAELKTVEGGWTVLHAPAMGYDLKKNLAMLRGFVFSIQDNKITDGKIVEIYGAPEYIEANQSHLLEWYIEFDLRDFSGSILTYDVNYQYRSGVKYEGGKIKHGARSQITRKMGEDKNMSARSQDEYWVDVYLVHHYSDGSSTWTYMYSYMGGGGLNGGNGGESPAGAAKIKEEGRALL